MSFTYAQKNRKENQENDAEPFGGSEMETSLPNSAQLSEPGHQVDMPVVMREKMEGAFGMDLSGVKLYENRAVGEAGAEAVTQGSKIAFAPGKLDFSSTRGQALLGHEISHVASQARGEVKSSGLVNDSALEARADREGLMAAHGESVSEGFGGASAPLSNASAASAAGPMQAKSGKKARETRERAEAERRARAEVESSDFYSRDFREADEDEELDGPIAPKNNLVANLRSMLKNQQSEIDLEKKTELIRKVVKNKQIKKRNELKKPKNWQKKISKVTKLNMGEIRESDEEYAEDLNEPLITNEIVPEIIEEEPEEIINEPVVKRSEFLEFMHNTVKQRPDQDQIIDFLNSIPKDKQNDRYKNNSGSRKGAGKKIRKKK